MCHPAQLKITWTCDKSHLGRNLQVKRRRPRPRRTFSASMPKRNAHGHVTRAILCGNLQADQEQAKPAPHVLCEPAQPKCTWTCHKRHFMQKITGKRPQAKSKPDHRRTFCTTLRSRNAHGHVTRAILCRNFQVKGRRPEQTKLARQTLCEPEQSKCTWTSHKSNFRPIFYENLQEKTRETKANTSIKHRHQPLP